MSHIFNIKDIEDVYASFFDKLDAALYAVDAQNRILHIGPAIERITSRPPADFIEKPFHSIVLPEDRTIAEHIINVAEGEVATGELRITGPDPGGTRCIVMGCKASRDGKAELIGVIAKKRVCADPHEYDPTLDEKMRKFSFAVEHSPATILITDKEGAIEYVNPKFTLLTGYEFSEVRGGNPRILKSGRQSAEFYKELWGTISSGKEWRGEFHNKKKNNDLYWESASISPIFNRKGEITHYIAVKEDITERKRAEEALLISEESLREKNFSMEREIQYARTVVNKLLPVNPPVHKNLLVDFHYIPMSAVGGDFFSFNSAGGRGMGVFIGDVAGHGVSAALFLSLLKSITHRLNESHATDPAHYLESLNEELYQGSDMFFITALYGFFDFSNGGAVFQFAKGGHPPPILYRAADGTTQQLQSEGIPVGIAKASGFEKTAWDLMPGDRLFLYTDGIIEARDENKEMIEPQGLEKIISRTRDMSLRGTLEYIIEEVRKFRRFESAEDDLVLIGFELLQP